MNLIDQKKDLGLVKMYEYEDEEDFMSAISISVPSYLID